jgi:hypothetical protein
MARPSSLLTVLAADGAVTRYIMEHREVCLEES